MKKNFEFIDEFNAKLYCEADKPDGIMISMDSFNEPFEGTVHLPTKKAIKLAKCILKLCDGK